MNAEELIAKVPNLPAPSFSVTRLLQLFARPDADHDEVICIVKQDGVLSAKLLARCNSATFGLASPVGSVDQAVFYLGHSQIHRIIMAISFGAALNPTLPGYAIEDGGLWRHSLVTAYATDRVLKATSVNLEPSIAYTAGLIHDIGKVVISYALNALSQELIRQIVYRGEHTFLEAEREVLGVDHAEVGAGLLQQWRLPDSIIEAVAHHHAPQVKPRPQLSAIVHVADIMAHESGASPGVGSFSLRLDEAAVEALELGPVEIQNLVIETLDALDDVQGMLSPA
jgi:putative nucleotidyltransferase with HDIG domain